MESEFRGTSRFQIERTLGAGGMGVVYQALDHERRVQVALKTLRTASPELLFRLKREFRALQELHHPNLIQLGELIEDQGVWFFTMELLAGRTFLEHVRGGPLAASEVGEHSEQASVSATTLRASPAQRLFDAAAGVPLGFDEPRLRHALAQLADGLRALHAAGLVHRDIKPSNVMVAPDGRVVVLDFGLVTQTLPGSGGTGAQVVGTAAYMAPEQASGGSVGPAADWYSFGVLLYEALVGHPPFAGHPLQVLMRKQTEQPPSPRSLVASLPADLDLLCMRLMQIDPAARPSGDSVVAQFADTPSGPAASSAPTPTSTGFVGRTEELELLRVALTQVHASKQVSLFLHGESGIGKSALIRRFTEEIVGDRDVVVFSGRCYERESVPYKAVDGVIDALSRYLRRLPAPEAAALTPRHASLLRTAFPVLEQLDEFAERRRVDRLEPQELRLRVFEALRDLFARLSERRTLIVTIDDLHWADNDSLLLLAELVRPPDPPPFLLLATWRQPSLTAAPVRERLDRYLGPVRHLEIGHLRSDEAEALAAGLVPSSVTTIERSVLQLIGREAQGHPLFIQELVRFAAQNSSAGGVTLEEALSARVQQLGPIAQRLLALLVLADSPIAQDVAARACELSTVELGQELTRLRAGHLVRVVGERIEPYHDHVRRAMAGALSPDDRRALHRRLADTLEATGSGDSEALALHFREAGELERARGYTLEAASRAEAALAFDHAARLYRRLLALPAHQETAMLQEKLGDALANAGQGKPAADAYIAAAAAAPAAQQLSLRKQAAEQLLMSGHIDEGVDEMRRVLNAIGVRMPETPRQSMRSLVIDRIRLAMRGSRPPVRLRAPDELTPEQLARTDIFWSMAVGFAIVDPIRSADFQTRHLVEALALAEPYRLAQAYAAEAAFSAAGGHRNQKRTHRLSQTAASLAERTGQSNARGFVAFAHALEEYGVGRWRASLERLERAEAILRDQCRGVTWWIDTVQYVALESLWYAGETAELARRVPKLLENALARGDLYAATNLRVGIPNLVWLVLDDVEAARAHVDEAMARWTVRGFHIQHEGELLARVQTSLYVGDGEAAHQRLSSTWKALRGSSIFTVQIARVASYHQRARAALAAASTLPATSSRRRALLAECRQAAACLRREGVAWAVPLAALARAGARSLDGEPEQAAAELEAAATGFSACGMDLYAQVARACRGRVIGGDEGAELVRAGDAALRAGGVLRPDRMTAMMAPGLR